MKSLSYLLMLYCFVFTFGCSSNKSKTPTSSSKLSTEIPSKDTLSRKPSNSPSIKKETEVEEKLDVKFVIKSKMKDDMPSSDISISVNGKITFLANIVSEASVSNEIGGKNSITACGGWWAGAGDYFYAAPSEKGVVVFKGWQEEEQEDSGYHWEKFTEISK